jgi:CRP-like cAMP-binding protein
MTFLRKVPFFEKVHPNAFQSLAYILIEREYPRNTIILRQGTDCEELFFIISGACRMVREIEDVPNDSNGSLTERCFYKNILNYVLWRKLIKFKKNLIKKGQKGGRVCRRWAPESCP